MIYVLMHRRLKGVGVYLGMEENEIPSLERAYKRDFIELTEAIHKFGYRWEEIAQNENLIDYDSLKAYVEAGDLSKVLGKWWGCSIANLYFYDQTEVETEAQIRWFHEVIDEGIDLPWLRILKRRENGIYEYERRPLEEKEQLRAEQHRLLKNGPFPPKAMFKMFAERKFRRSLSERKDGWILVPLGEILTYTFEWHLREKAAEIQALQPNLDITSYFRTEGLKTVQLIWADLMDKVGEAGEDLNYFEKIMLAWIRDVIQSEREYRDWWQKSDGNYDWFIILARQSEGINKLMALFDPSSFEQKLLRFAQILVESWDYQFHDGADLNWEKFVERLRFSPPLQVERFGTRNLVAFPTWLQWLQNGGKMVSTNAAFVFAGFYDEEVARHYARNIQTFFILLTQPDIARHTVPNQMLAKVGIIAEATTYELRQQLSSATSIIETLLDKTDQRKSLSAEYLHTNLQNLRRAVELIDRVANDLLYLPTQNSLKLDITPVHVNELLLKALDICSLDQPVSEEGIAVVKDFDTLPVIQGDEDRLRHIFLETIINAKEAMHNRPEKRLEVITQKIKESVIVSISDTGMGINKEIEPKIFNPFFSTKEPKGMGLGLFNAKHLVRLHNGEINISHNEAGGTKVTITLPIADHREDKI